MVSIDFVVVVVVVFPAFYMAQLGFQGSYDALVLWGCSATAVHHALVFLVRSGDDQTVLCNT
jgi:hypothetical protein